MCSWAWYLLQQLSQPVQLRLQLFVVVLQYLHPGLQPPFVLPQQLGLGDQLGVSGALRRHRQHLRGRRQRRQALPVVGFLQAVVLGLQLPVGPEESREVTERDGYWRRWNIRVGGRWTFVWLIKPGGGLLQYTVWNWRMNNNSAPTKPLDGVNKGRLTECQPLLSHSVFRAHALLIHTFDF